MEKKLAIIGHPLEGNKVIEILKMLGGRDVGYNGLESQYYYYIDEYGNIAGTAELPNNKILFIIYTLKEFLEKFPYKVGDKVQRNGATSCSSIYVIEKMNWEDNQVKYIICDLYWKNCKCTVTSKDLQPYKEETVEVTKKFKQNYCRNCGSQRCSGDGEWLEECEHYKNEQRTMEEIKIDIPKGYKFSEVDDNSQRVVFTKIQPEYPKTYEECCKILNIPVNGDIVYAGNWVYGGEYLDKHLEKIKNFQKLLICRNAYWKTYGERMGLGKPWEPDWTDDCIKYVITFVENKIYTDVSYIFNYVLSFPTAEMRDVFSDSEEIAQLIKNCKEFL